MVLNSQAATRDDQENAKDARGAHGGKRAGLAKPKAMAKSPRLSMAKRADRYDLYLKSVQAPDVDVGFFQRVYRAAFNRPAEILREDFCGTAAVCCEWVRARRTAEAYGVDIDPEPLAWGREHNLSSLSAAQVERVHLVEGDVRAAVTPKADIIAAQNFSYMFFKTREMLRGYFRSAFAQLAAEGVLILDLYGGYEALEDDREEVTEHEGFDYVWEQASFDPITADAECHIHFRFPDGSELRRAFSYHWRLWTIPEVRELVLEAGFPAAEVYWEATDRTTGEGSGIYRRAERGESDPAWNAYIIGYKGQRTTR